MSERSTNSLKPGDPLRKVASELRKRAAARTPQNSSEESMIKAAQVLVGVTALVQLNNQIYG